MMTNELCYSRAVEKLLNIGKCRFRSEREGIGNPAREAIEVGTRAGEQDQEGPGPPLPFFSAFPSALGAGKNWR